jgi:hypothetical protein
MLSNCAGVAAARRGFADGGKRSSAPLCRTTKIKPSRNPAERGASIKVLMPLVDNKLSVYFSKLVCPGELAHFQAERFAKLNAFLNVEHRFAAAVANMNVNRSVLVAVKEKAISILLEDFWHRLIIFEFPAAGRKLRSPPRGARGSASSVFAPKCTWNALHLRS